MTHVLRSVEFGVSMKDRTVLSAAVCVGALWISSCGGTPVGPSLFDVEITNLRLEPTTSNPALCCCRVKATVENHNTRSVHLTIKFSALDGISDDPIVSILHFVSDLEPETPRDIDAAGFIVPCSSIRDVTTDVDANGIGFPPI
jgi:hypothetical protein